MSEIPGNTMERGPDEQDHTRQEQQYQKGKAAFHIPGGIRRNAGAAADPLCLEEAL